MSYRVTLQGHDGSGIETLRYATHGHYDDYGNYYEPRLLNAGNFEISLFSSGKTRGECAVGVGEIVVDNRDGGLDCIKGWGFSSRPVLIESVADDGGATLIWKGTVEQPVVGLKDVQFRIRDRLEDLRKQFQSNLFAGTTINGGLAECEGQASDIKGQPKPWISGRVFNVTPAAGNVYDLIYQVHDGEVSDIPFVWDKSVRLTNANQDYPTLAALRAATIAPGKYGTCKAGGYFRLGASPAGDITCDVIVGATTADRTVGAAILRVLDKAGIDQSEWPDVAGLPAYECGIFVSDDTTTLDIINQLAASVGAYFVPTRDGKFASGVFVGPSAATAELDIADILDIQPKVPGDDGRGVPPWKVTVKYARNWSVQSGGEVGDKEICVTASRKAFLAKEYRDAVAENTAIKTKHPGASEITIETLLVNEADAQAEAARWLALYAGVADMADIKVKPYTADAISAGQTIRVTYPRLGWDNGVDVVVIGRTIDYRENAATLEVWRVIS